MKIFEYSGLGVYELAPAGIRAHALLTEIPVPRRSAMYSAVFKSSEALHMPQDFLHYRATRTYE